MTNKKTELSKNTQTLNSGNASGTVFEHHLAVKNLVVRSNPKKDDPELSEKIAQTKESLALLNPQDAQQLMLAAQMQTVYDLQQEVAAYAFKCLNRPDLLLSYINATAKLSNIFMQQLGVINKLQGKGQQKVVVEHVTVHSGGQAVVGTVESHADMGTSKNDK